MSSPSTFRGREAAPHVPQWDVGAVVGASPRRSSSGSPQQQPSSPVAGYVSPLRRLASSSNASPVPVDASAAASPSLRIADDSAHGGDDDVPSRARFLEFDISGDGRLSLDEVAALVAAMELPADRLFLRGIFAQLDKNHSGHIEYGEFAQLWSALKAEQRFKTSASIGRAPPVNFEVRCEGQASAGLSLSKKLNPGLTSVALAGRALRDAARRGDMATVRAVLEKGVVDIDEGDANREFETALHVAAGEGHEAVVQALLANGATPSAQNTAGWTPLHRAALWGQLGTAQLLVQGGADLKARQVHGLTPHAIATQYGRSSIIELLGRLGIHA